MTKARKFGPIGVRPQTVLNQKTGKWFVDIPASLTSTGKRRRKLYANKTTAEKSARELSGKLRMRELGYLEQRSQSTTSFEQGAIEWIGAQSRRVRTGKIGEATLATRRHELKPLRVFFGGYTVSAINSDLMEKYQERRLDDGCAPRTVNSELATFKQVLRWLAARGYLSNVPTVESIPLNRPRRDIPTREEVVSLIQYLPEKVKPIVRLMAETGMRPGEVFNLPWHHVNEIEGYVDIRPFDDWKPKTEGSNRRVRLSPGMRSEMRRIPKIGIFVFSGRATDKPVGSIKRALASAVHKSGLSRNNRPLRITAKTFRKAFATWQAEDRVHPSILQKQMGHVEGSRMTDKYYIHVSEEAVMRMFKELPMDGPERKEDETSQHLAISGNGPNIEFSRDGKKISNTVPQRLAIPR